jgi:acyl-CoA thioesterase
MNGGAVSALCARAAELHDDPDAARSEQQIMARLTVDLVRPAPLAPLTVRTSTVRPGRTVQLVAVEVAADGVVVSRALALRMRTADLPLPRPAQDPPPPFAQEAVAQTPPDAGVEHFHSHALEVRRVVGDRSVILWARMRCQVVEGEEASSQQRAAGIADMGSGVSSVVPFSEWRFLNVDVDLHLHRAPRGEWLCLTCETQAGDSGVAVAVSSMFDRDGCCGHVAQAVLLQRR